MKIDEINEGERAAVVGLALSRLADDVNRGSAPAKVSKGAVRTGTARVGRSGRLLL